MIDVTCSCGRKISVPVHFAGKSGKCKGCGTRLVIPKPKGHLASSNQDLHDADWASPFDQVSLVTPLEAPAEFIPSTPSCSIESLKTNAANSRQKAYKPRKRWLAHRLLVAVGLFILVALGALVVARSLYGPNYYALAPDALKSGDADLAEKYYRLGLQQAIREDRHFFIAVTHQGLASVAFERGNWAEAEREAKIAIEEFLCPKNENKDSRDYNLVGCFQTMGYSQIFQGEFKEGVRNVEEADKISAETTNGFNEPTASLEMAKMYRTVASLSQQAQYYWRAIERIEKAEEGLLFSKFGSLLGSLLHVSILREKAQIVRESGLQEEDPDAIESEANRIEEGFHARSRADRARHELPSRY